MKSRESSLTTMFVVNIAGVMHPLVSAGGVLNGSKQNEKKLSQISSSVHESSFERLLFSAAGSQHSPLLPAALLFGLL